jgi:choline kinase
MSVTVAVILAAGVGSRLRPLTDDRPKALVGVNGHSILKRAVDALEAKGVTKLVIATGYREDALRRALSDAPFDIEYVQNPRYESTQNSVSLALCESAVGGAAFYRLDGDVVFDAEVLARLDGVDAPLVAAVDPSRTLDAEAMKVRIEQGRIVEFGKGIPLAGSAGESIGIERISAEASPLLFAGLNAAIRRGETSLYYEDVYSRLIADGLVVKAADVTGLPWCEIDCEEDLTNAARLFSP